jgi:hypothetical protein
VVQEESNKIYFVILDAPTGFYEFWKFEPISIIYLNKNKNEKE